MDSDEERDGRAVRTLMARVELPPSHVDIDRAVRTGRRRERRRQVLIVAAAAASVVGVSGAVAVGIGSGHRPDGTAVTPTPTATVTPVSCTFTALPTPDGHTPASLYAADETGRYLIGSIYDEAEQRTRAALWVDGSPTVFEVPGAGTFTDPTDVNSAGVVVGGVSGESGGTFVWTYRNGKVTKLPNPQGYRAGGPAAINERGDVAAPASGSAGVVVVVWPASAPDEPRILHAPGLRQVSDIADDGTVVGAVGDETLGPADAGTPYVWSPEGVGRELAVPAGWESSVLKGVHGDWIVGSVHTGPQLGTPTGGTFAPARWRLSTGEVEVWPTITGDTVLAGVEAVTESGWMSVRVSERKWVLVGPDGRVLRLENRDGSDGHFRRAVWVGDDGRTGVGDADFGSDDIRPARWRCETG